MTDCARYNVRRSGDEWEAYETTRLICGNLTFVGPSDARWIEAPTRDQLWTKLRSFGGTRHFRRKSKWIVIFGGTRETAED